MDVDVDVDVGVDGDGDGDCDGDCDCDCDGDCDCDCDDHPTSTAHVTKPGNELSRRVDPNDAAQAPAASTSMPRKCGATRNNMGGL
jgi:hypothetical protein